MVVYHLTIRLSSVHRLTPTTMLCILLCMENTLPRLYVLTCAPKDRGHEAEKALDSACVSSESDRIVVTTQPNPIDQDSFRGTVLLFDSEEINISKWWGLGMDYIRSNRPDNDPFDVLIIESDARMSEEDVDHIRHIMRKNNCVMGGADWKELLPPDGLLIRRDNTRHDVDARLPGVAYIIAGVWSALKHDLQYRFWNAAVKIEWLARTNGGTVLVGGTTVEHTGHVTSGGLVGDIAQFAAEDVIKFKEEWGATPHDGGI